jgi:hypothetical protein
MAGKGEASLAEAGLSFENDVALACFGVFAGRILNCI